MSDAVRLSHVLGRRDTCRQLCQFAERQKRHDALFQAIDADDVGKLEELLAQGVNIQAKGLYDLRPFPYALAGNKFKIIGAFMEKNFVIKRKPSGFQLVLIRYLSHCFY